MSAPVVIPLHPVPEPLGVFERLSHLDNPLLLDSASNLHNLGRYSFASANPVALLIGEAAMWPQMQEQLRSTMDETRSADPALPPFQGGWAGWFGYELGAAFDQMPVAPRNELGLPDVSLALYDWVIAWDHVADRAWLISTGADHTGETDPARARVRADRVLGWLSMTPSAVSREASIAGVRGSAPITAFPGVAELTGDFTPAQYQESVARVIEYILAGDIFQANLTQRFVAPFAGSPIELYRRLRARTEAPMSALLQRGDSWVVSASPERFMRYSPVDRVVETRPIKGTASRGAPSQSFGASEGDAEEIANLLASEKDRAENVMIVDLLRNDLSRVCVPGSVEVPSLCAVETHPTVHHLVSTVVGTLAPGHDALDLLAATFPGGSITGAPKLRAMAILAELEPVTRGVYCGCIGWLGLDGAMDTSIAIRTITCTKGVAVINVGGGVTALSNPKAEYHETLDKAAALIAALGEAT